MVERSTARRGPLPEQRAAVVIFALVAAWRVELCLLAPPVALGVWTYLHFGSICAGVVVTFLVLVMVVPAPPRHFWPEYCIKQCAAATGDGVSVVARCAQRPSAHVVKIIRTNVGDRVELGLRHGTSIEELQRPSPSLRPLSACVRCAWWWTGSPDHVTLSITRRDPFESTSAPCPLVTAAHFDAWSPIPSAWTKKERSSPCPCRAQCPLRG